MKKTLTLLALATAINFSSKAQTVTNFGVLPVYRDITSQMNAAKNLGVNYVRQTIVLSSWSGINTNVNTWQDNGYKIIMNINNDVVFTPFPTDLVSYEANFRSVLDVYTPEAVVVENEELNEPGNTSTKNPLYHIGSIQDYINELTVAVRVCNQKHVQVTNGGLTSPIIQSLHNYYLVNNKPDSAQWLGQQMHGVLDDPRTISRVDSLLSAYKTLSLSFVNLHWYEPQKGLDHTTGVLQTVINYITQQTGKSVITNETGLKTDNPAMVTDLMTQWNTAQVKYAIFIDSNGIDAGGAYPLTSSVGALLNNGTAYRDFLLSRISATQYSNSTVNNIRQNVKSSDIYIKVYPNPATQLIHIDGLNQPGKKVITVTNFSGTVMGTAECSANGYTWNVSQLPNGNYYVTVQEGKQYITKTFVKN